MRVVRLPIFAVLALMIGATVLGFSAARAATYPKVESIMKQPLDDLDGREMRIDVVTFEPGAEAPQHRHPGHVFVYVIEGEIISQLEDGPAETFKAGDCFYEPTNGLHAVTKNPSDSETAKILVMMIMEEGKPSLTLHAH